MFKRRNDIQQLLMLTVTKQVERMTELDICYKTGNLFTESGLYPQPPMWMPSSVDFRR